ncbi:GHKL domain-containing protein [Lysinibacillus antri]|uniref:GHKL domain-containing protein n=2 Tax=Lysinibacillus antri TaxID=2498145 RepID=A0A432LB71_9BACI|nr:GHKL domain-containing protein [Lysinibacillus antri]
MKKSRLSILLILSTVLFIFFTMLGAHITSMRMQDTVEESIANHSLEVAKAIVQDFDIEAYENFLLKQEKNEHYWKIRRDLNAIREKIGALYVYTLAIDNPAISKTMIVGASGNFKIGDSCTVPKKYVEQAYYQNAPYVTEEILDPKYGSYLSVGVPIHNGSGQVIGYLGIDISAESISAIEETVMENNVMNFLINIIFILTIIVCFLLLQRWYQKKVSKEVGNTEDTYQAELKTLIASVSSLKHDYANHMQVLHGLLQIGKTNRALEYVTSLTNEIQMIEKLQLNVDHPGLAILLQTKKLATENYQIDMDLSISSNGFNQIKSIDLIKILSNLIDNAIDATLELPEEHRKIQINCHADETKYIFKVVNTCSSLVDNKVIFNQGFSTKAVEDGKIRGQGLFIVKEIVNSYNGTISLNSTAEQEVTAIVEIPIKGRDFTFKV